MPLQLIVQRWKIRKGTLARLFPILVPLGCGVDEGISRGRIRFRATADEALRAV